MKKLISKIFKSKKNRHAQEKGYQELARLVKESSEKHETFNYVPCVVANLRERENLEYFRTSRIG